jgi:predicted negative regulator of RcsB-dependent stress response
MKWVIIIFVAVIGYMIYTGNMGGAQKATKNYREVMTSPKNGEARPAPMYEYLKNKPKGSLY